MILVVATLLCCLTVFNYLVARSWLYPPLLFCAIWATALLILDAAAHLFYPVSPESLLVYFIGAVAFSIGGVLSVLIRVQTSPGRLSIQRRPTPPVIERALDWALLGGIALLPFYISYMRWLSSLSSEDSFWERVRRSTLEVTERPGGAGFHLAPALLPVLAVFAVIGTYELDDTKNKFRTWALVILAFGYEVLSTARTDILLFLLGLLVTRWARSRTIPKRLVLASLSLFVTLVLVNQLILGKQGADPDASLSSNVPALTQGLAVYAVGSLITFEAVMNDGDASDASSTLKFFIRAANRFGANLPEPARHLDYIAVSTGSETNTYSIYLPIYPHGGLIGVMTVMSLLGLFTSVIYQFAQRGSPIGIFLLHPALYGVCMSVFAECFSSELGYWLKLAIVVWLLYYFPARKIPKGIISSRRVLLPVRKTCLATAKLGGAVTTTSIQQSDSSIAECSEGLS